MAGNGNAGSHDPAKAQIGDALAPCVAADLGQPGYYGAYTMSHDNRTPPDGCIGLDTARSRWLENVNFEPILAALNSLSKVACRLAATGAPELVFQFTDRWTELENVLAASGLTANALWMFDLENENSRRRHEAWDYLRGLLLDVPKKYVPQNPANHNILAKRLAVAVEMVQEVTPSETPPDSQHPSLTDEDRYILTVLEANCGKSLTYARILKESVRMEIEDRTKVRRLSDSTVRARVKVLESHGMVARPIGTKKKGISITDQGFRALGFARENSTET